MIEFTCHNPILQQLFDAATRGLAANVRLLEPNPAPLLIEGSWYLGVWLECAPMEGLLYAPFSPQTASNNHRIFFAHQRSDGQFPAWCVPDGPDSDRFNRRFPSPKPPLNSPC